MIIKEDCDLIRVESDILEDVSIYDTLDITMTVNCCDEEVTEQVTISATPDNYTATVPENATIDIIKMRNISTNEEYDVEIGETITDCDELGSEVLDALNDGIETSCGACIAFTSTCVDTTPSAIEFTIIVTGNIIPISITYTLAGIEYTVYFYSHIADTIQLHEGKLLIRPSMLGLTSFVDGIYNISLSLEGESGANATDQSCFFYDCQTKCDVITFINSSACTTDFLETEILMLHYSLTLSSNCGCHCDEMCESFKTLLKKIGNNQNQNSFHCGC
jgi:hypothetical protein